MKRQFYNIDETIIPGNLKGQPGLHTRFGARGGGVGSKLSFLKTYDEQRNARVYIYRSTETRDGVL